MLYLDDQFIRKEDFQKVWAQLDSNPTLRGCERLAVCTTDAFLWLAVLLYCRQSGRSVGPITADTPRLAAGEKARKMGCSGLLWQHAEHIQLLPCAQSQSGTLIQFSSGTTGAPKRIERRWEDIKTETQRYNQALGLDQDVTPVVACPITHSYGLICGVLAAFARDAVPHVVTGWNPKYLLRILQSYVKPLLYSSPSFIHALMTIWPAGQPLYGVMTSGSVMPAAWLNQLNGVALHIWQQYGCSEAGCVALVHNPQAANVLGQALGHCSITAGNSVQTPEEILVHQNGQLIGTWDLGYFNEQSQLCFLGRLDDTIVVSGLNVYPLEVEEALMAHPQINEVAVFRRQDALAGERVAAVFAASTHVTHAEIRQWCSARLARHQWPSWSLQVREVPRLAGGKISRRFLSAHFDPSKDSVRQAEAI